MLVEKWQLTEYAIGYMHMDVEEVFTEKGGLQIFVAIDRAGKFVLAELHEKKTKEIVPGFPCNVIVRVPCKIHRILTDNGLHFTGRKRGSGAAEHGFDCICRDNGIEHRLAKINHPWTNGQVERMNRALKATMVKCHHSVPHDQPRAHQEVC